MEIKTKLLMTFKTSDDKKVSITVDNPREDLTETEIKEAMNTIIEKDIFSPNGGSLVSAVSAKVVQTDTTDYDLVLYTMDSSLQTLVANVGFPIAISMYLLVRIEGKLNSLTDSINKLSNNINIIK